MSHSYWARYLTDRVVSRRLVVLAGAGTLSGALLAACGGGSSSGASQPAAGTSGSPLVAKPANTTASAVKGGIWVRSRGGDLRNFDPMLNTGGTSVTGTGEVYSRLLKYKVSQAPTAPDGSVEGDAAESFEVSPDGMQVTLKLRQGMGFDPRPPTNGRLLSAEDIRFTWNKFATKHPTRTDIAHSASPEAPIESMETPDDHTVVVKLAFPYPPILDLLAYPKYINIEPKEADGGFDPTKDVRGSGPYLIDEYRPSVSLKYRRNPGWYQKDFPYLDGIDEIIVPEYATGVAQFRAGQLWTYNVKTEEVVNTKKALPQLLMLQQGSFDRDTPYQVEFGYNPGSPFLDQRVRQACSMLIDRDLWMQSFYNVKAFHDQGLDLTTRWYSWLVPGDQKEYLDPTGKDFGDNAKYFKADPAEATKMIAAAGFKTPISMNLVYSSDYVPRNNVVRGIQTIAGFYQDSGNFSLKQKQVDGSTEWRQVYTDVGGMFDGLIVNSVSQKANVDQFLFSHYSSQASEKQRPMPDPAIDDLLRKQRAERDPAKRIQIIDDVQRALTQAMYAIPYDGDALGFDLVWPWLGNYDAYLSRESITKPQEGSLYLWYDASKKTG